MRFRPRSSQALVIGLFMLLTGGVASAQPGGPDEGAPSPAPATAENAQKACTLRPAAHSPRDEWASCLRVEANMTKPPAVGERTTMRFKVTAERALDNVRIEADLPGNLRWVNVPSGMRRGHQPTAAPESYGGIDRASEVRSLAAGQTVAFEGMVTAVADGPAQIRARASVAMPGGTDAAEDSVFVTAGKAEAPSSFGIDTPEVGAVSPIAAGVTPRRASPRLPQDAVGTQGLAKPASDDPKAPSRTQANACVSGGWFYVDQRGATRPTINFQVQVWDRDATGGDDRLATGVTDGSGRYNLCFNNDDDGFGAGTQDVYVNFVSENPLWRVRRTGTNNNFVYGTSTVDGVANGSNTSFGNLQPGISTDMRGLHAFDAANDAWQWIPGSTCWDNLDATCRQMVIDWAPASTDGTYYATGSNVVHLKAADPDAPMVVVHEIGHGVMDDVYEDSFPPIPNCETHTIPGATSAGCAWAEGWAEWFPLMIYRDQFFRWPSGASVNLETPTWGTSGWANGDTVEGRVAGAMIDISDSTNEAPYDRWAEGAPGNLWTTFTRHRSNTFAEFWGHRTADGFNVADSGARACLYQNTINYGFTREPTTNN